MERIVRILSGVLFIMAGLLTLFNFKPLPPPDARTLVGILLIVTGAGISFKIPPKDSFLLGLSIVILIISLSKFEFGPRVIANVHYSLNLTCKELDIKLMMSEAKLETGLGALNVTGPKEVAAKLGSPCSLDLCCSHVEAKIGEPKRLSLMSTMSDAKITIRNCVRSISISNQMGDVEAIYYVPKGCGGSIFVTSNLGDTKLTLIIPSDVKVVYDVRANLGSAIVETPMGTGMHGAYGNGTVLKLSGTVNMGDLKVVIKRG